MNRFYALVLALLFAGATVSSACAASPADVIGFTFRSERGGTGLAHADLRDPFKPSELIGLDVSGFRGSGTHGRFALP